MKNSIVYYCITVLLMGIGAAPVCGCTKNKNISVPQPVVMDTTVPRPVSDSGQPRWLALGDSYTIGQSVTVNERYPVQTVDVLRGMDVNMPYPEIIAVTGWTTQDLLNALKNNPPTASTYSLVTLLIGVNNQYQGRSLDEYKTQFTTLLQQAIKLAGNRPGRVVVLSVPDYSVTPFANGRDRAAIAHEIDNFNAVNKQISDQYQVLWLDITMASRMAAADPALIASDSLHFSGKEYRTWASMLAPMLKKALQ